MPFAVKVENHVISGEIEICEKPDRVFQALIDPKQVVKWWGSAETYTVKRFYFEPNVGGCWRLQAASSDAEEFLISGEVLEYDPPRVLAFTWNPSWQAMPTTVVRFELEPRGNGTQLRLVHRGFTPDSAGLETHRYGWPLVLDWLSAYLKR